MVLPFAIAFELIDIGEGSLDDDKGGGETDQAHEGHEDVDGGDFHLIDLTVVIIAGFRAKGKAGFPA